MRTYDEDIPALEFTHPNRVTQVREYEVITPIFGGGVLPGVPDENQLVRGTTVRGNLRLWWRAARGGQFDSVADMKAVEDVLFGSAATTTDTDTDTPTDTDTKKTGGPSPLQVTVEMTQKGTPVPPYTIAPNKYGKPEAKPVADIPTYASFPLKPERGRLNEPVRNVTKGVHFTLTLQYPQKIQLNEDVFPNEINYREEIDAALWAWETFGGVGARTRRGFGALYCKTIGSEHPATSKDKDVRAWLDAQFKKHVRAPSKYSAYPRLYEDTQYVAFLRDPQKTATHAWKLLIDKLKTFRSTQRTPEEIRSWPEPDNVRRLKNVPVSRDFLPGSVPNEYVFPRSEFGLPIIYQFPQEGDMTATLTLVGYDRLASPIILRPLRCADGMYVGMAMLLNIPDLPADLQLNDVKKQGLLRQKLNHTEAKAITKLGGKSDVLVAFLDTIEK